MQIRWLVDTETHRSGQVQDVTCADTVAALVETGRAELYNAQPGQARAIEDRAMSRPPRGPRH